MVRLRLNESSNPRYIYVSPTTNTVHLMVPVSASGGTEIATDNTCKTVFALKEFFGKNHDSAVRKNSALDELIRFRGSLEIDIGILRPDDAVRVLKEDRLRQVNHYITVLTNMRADASLNGLSAGLPHYPDPIKEILRAQSNLYGMRLRPRNLDHFLRIERPNFTMDRSSGADTLYHALLDCFNGIRNPPARQTPRDALIAFALPTVRVAHQTIMSSADSDAEKVSQIRDLVCRALSEAFQEKYGAVQDFISGEWTNDAFGALHDVATADNLNELAEFIINETAEFVDIFPANAESCFYEVTDSATNDTEKKKKLNIMTQFLLAEINFYAHANDLSTQDFGRIFDTNRQLAQALSAQVRSTFEARGDVEQAVCQFMSSNKVPLNLCRDLTPEESKKISTRFNTHFGTIKEHVEFDEFMVLDTEKPGQFFKHQAGLCFDFSRLLKTSLRQRFPDSVMVTMFRADREIDSLSTELSARDPGQIGARNIEDAQLKADISQAIRGISASNYEETCWYVHSLLMAKLDSGQSVFEWCGREFFVNFKADPDAKRLFCDIRSRITDAAVSNAFNRLARGIDAQLFLTHDMCRALYTSVVATTPYTATPDTENRVSQYESEDALRAMLSALDIDNPEITRGYNGTFTVETTTENLERLQGLVENHTVRFHLTPDMARSIYKEVEKQFGLQSHEYTHMQSLDNEGNPPAKIQYAMRLLNIRSDTFSFPNNNQGTNGYILSGTPAMVTLINAIHADQSRRYQLTSEMAADLYSIVASAPDPVPRTLLNELTNEQRPDKCEMALALLNITYDRVVFNQPDGYVLYLSPVEQAKLSIIVRSNGHIPPSVPEKMREETNLECQHYRAEASVPSYGSKNARGLLIRRIQARAREGAPTDPSLRGRRGGAGMFAAAATEDQRIREEPPRHVAPDVAPGDRIRLTAAAPAVAPVFAPAPVAAVGQGGSVIPTQTIAQQLGIQLVATTGPWSEQKYLEGLSAVTPGVVQGRYVPCMPMVGEVRMEAAAAAAVAAAGGPSAAGLYFLQGVDALALGSFRCLNDAVVQVAGQANGTENTDPVVRHPNTYSEDYTQGPRSQMMDPIAASARYHAELLAGGYTQTSQDGTLSRNAGLSRASLGCDFLAEWRKYPHFSSIFEEKDGYIHPRPGQEQAAVDFLTTHLDALRINIERINPECNPAKTMIQVIAFAFAFGRYGSPHFIAASRYTLRQKTALDDVSYLLLKAQYELIARVAVIEAHAHQDRRIPLVLTLVGGGVFGNTPEVIDRAVADAMTIVRNSRMPNIDVCVSAYEAAELDRVKGYLQRADASYTGPTLTSAQLNRETLAACAAPMAAALLPPVVPVVEEGGAGRRPPMTASAVRMPVYEFGQGNRITAVERSANGLYMAIGLNNRGQERRIQFRMSPQDEFEYVTDNDYQSGWVQDFQLAMLLHDTKIPFLQMFNLRPSAPVVAVEPVSAPPPVAAEEGGGGRRRLPTDAPTAAGRAAAGGQNEFAESVRRAPQASEKVRLGRNDICAGFLSENEEGKISLQQHGGRLLMIASMGANPPHPMHLKLIEESYNSLSPELQDQVVILVTPSPDAYLQGKYAGDRQKHAGKTVLPTAARCAIMSGIADHIFSHALRSKVHFSDFENRMHRILYPGHSTGLFFDHPESVKHLEYAFQQASPGKTPAAIIDEYVQLIAISKACLSGAINQREIMPDTIRRALQQSGHNTASDLLCSWPPSTRASTQAIRALFLAGEDLYTNMGSSYTHWEIPAFCYPRPATEVENGISSTNIWKLNPAVIRQLEEQSPWYLAMIRNHMGEGWRARLDQMLPPVVPVQPQDTTGAAAIDVGDTGVVIPHGAATHVSALGAAAIEAIEEAIEPDEGPRAWGGAGVGDAADLDAHVDRNGPPKPLDLHLYQEFAHALGPALVEALRADAPGGAVVAVAPENPLGIDIPEGVLDRYLVGIAKRYQSQVLDEVYQLQSEIGVHREKLVLHSNRIAEELEALEVKQNDSTSAERVIQIEQKKAEMNAMDLQIARAADDNIQLEQFVAHLGSLELTEETFLREDASLAERAECKAIHDVHSALLIKDLVKVHERLQRLKTLPGIRYIEDVKSLSQLYESYSETLVEVRKLAKELATYTTSQESVSWADYALWRSPKPRLEKLELSKKTLAAVDDLIRTMTANLQAIASMQLEPAHASNHVIQCEEYATRLGSKLKRLSGLLKEMEDSSQDQPIKTKLSSFRSMLEETDFTPSSRTRHPEEELPSPTSAAAASSLATEGAGSEDEADAMDTPRSGPGRG